MDIQKVIDSLNNAFQRDPIAMRLLLINLVQCNEKLADHPTIQVANLEGGYTLSVIGFVNGIMAELGLPLIASKWESEADKDGIHKFLGFQIFGDKKE